MIMSSTLCYISGFIKYFSFLHVAFYQYLLLILPWMWRSVRSPCDGDVFFEVYPAPGQGRTLATHSCSAAKKKKKKSTLFVIKYHIPVLCVWDVNGGLQRVNVHPLSHNARLSHLCNPDWHSINRLFRRPPFSPLHCCCSTSSDTKWPLGPHGLQRCGVGVFPYPEFFFFNSV